MDGYLLIFYFCIKVHDCEVHGILGTLRPNNETASLVSQGYMLQFFSIRSEQ